MALDRFAGLSDQRRTDSNRIVQRLTTRWRIAWTSARLIKVYRATPEGERKDSPVEVVSMDVVPVLGEPDPHHLNLDRICTSHIERQNLTMRMSICRLTRLTGWLQQEVGESVGCALLALRLLQLLSDSQNIAGHAWDGSGDCGSRVDCPRTARGRVIKWQPVLRRFRSFCFSDSSSTSHRLQQRAASKTNQCSFSTPPTFS